MDDSFWELATKYLSNEASDEDMNTLFKLIEENEDYQKLYGDLAKKWNQLEGYVPGTIDVKSAKKRLGRHIFTVKKSSKPFSVQFKVLSGIAASLAVILGIFMAVHFSEKREWKEFTTNEKEKLRVVLPDSTQVWLNTNSSLSYNFSNPDKREIRLRGEAFFDVKRDTLRPFLVQSAHFETKVLGTSFNIRSHQHEDHSVSVLSGKVAVTEMENENTVHLVRGQKAYFKVSTAHIHTENVLGIDNETAWIAREFKFDDIPLETALSFLSKTYSVRFEFQNPSLKNCHITARFDNESLLTIMNRMTASLDCEYTYHRLEKKIILQGAGCEKNQRIVAYPLDKNQ